MEELILWDIYDITSCDPLHSIRFRGRLRKLALLSKVNLLVENAVDEENIVRFAVVSGLDVKPVKDLIKFIEPKAEIKKNMTEVKNPVLSKLKVNIEDRYTEIKLDLKKPLCRRF